MGGGPPTDHVVGSGWRMNPFVVTIVFSSLTIFFLTMFVVYVRKEG